MRYLYVLLCCFLLACPLSGRATTTLQGLTYNRLERIQLDVLQHAVNRSHLPTTEEGLVSLRQLNGTAFDPSEFRDSWGEPLIYRSPSASKERLFDLYSKGPNRRDDGGTGDDVVVWEYRDYYSGAGSLGIFERAFGWLMVIDGPILLACIGLYAFRCRQRRKTAAQ